MDGSLTAPADRGTQALNGAILESVGRSAATGVLELAGAAGGTIQLRLRCPFRIRQGDRTILGSSDMQTRHDDPTGALPRGLETTYDVRAFALTGILMAVRPAVFDAEEGAHGALSLCWGNSYALEAFPATSADAAAWQISVYEI
jgi:hypothetical protein